MEEFQGIRSACEKKIAEETAQLRKHKSSGKKTIGYTCHAFPAALVAGLGLWPLRIVCGTTSSSGYTGEKIIRPDICPFVKSLIGNISEDRWLHSEIDLWIGLYTCDQMRRGMDLISNDLKKDVYPIQLPATRTEEAAGYYTGQIKRFVCDMEIRHQVIFEAEKALAWQTEYDEAGSVLKKAALSGRLSPLDLHSMFHLLFFSRPHGLSVFFQDMILKTEDFKSSRTIVVAGSPITYEDTLLYEILEKKGIAVVPLNCTGLNAVDITEVKTDIYDEISSFAMGSFYKPACARARPNTEVYERISETLETTNASGIIVKCLKSCDHWYTERERMRKTFALPILVYDSDYSGGGRERLISRIDALIETL